MNAESFEEAVAYLETVAMTSAGHFIVGGVKENEGIILSRDAHRTDRVERLADSERGFIAMTNADVWMVEDSRHITAVQAMEDLLSLDSQSMIQQVLWAEGVLRHDSIFSADVSARPHSVDEFKAGATTQMKIFDAPSLKLYQNMHRQGAEAESQIEE